MSARGVRWCFTINNPTEEDVHNVKHLSEQDWVKSAIAEFEHLNEGTPHIQGFMILNGQKYLSWLKNAYFGPRIHLEVARGTTKQAWDYCTKEGNIIIEYNKPDTVDRTPHRRGDELARNILRDIGELDEEDFKEQYPSFYLRNKPIYDQHRISYLQRTAIAYNSELHDKNLWLYGPTGTGKTTFALSGLPVYQIYSKPATNKWFDGFDPARHKRVVLDDLPILQPGSNIPYYLKIWADHYGCTVEKKGSGTFLDARIPIIVTSNFSIDEAIPNEIDRQAIKRRFREVYWDGHNIEMYSECPSFGHYLGQVSPAQRPQPVQIPQRPVTPQSAQYSEYQTDDEDSIIEEDNPFDTPLNTSIRPDSIPSAYEISPLERRMMELRKEREESGYYN